MRRGFLFAQMKIRDKLALFLDYIFKGKIMTISRFQTIACAGLLSVSFAFAERANAVVGQPFLIADANTSGSILDFFTVFGPSGAKELSLSAEVTSNVGAPGTTGMRSTFRVACRVVEL